MKRLIFITILLMCSMFLGSCAEEGDGKFFLYSEIPEVKIDWSDAIITDVNDEEAKRKVQEEEKQNMREMGRKTKELSQVPGIDEAAIQVGKKSITKKSIELMRYSDDDQRDDLLKREIILSVRKQVVEQEAERRNLTVEQDKIDAVIQQQRQDGAAYAAGAVEGYIEEVGITEEEYWKNGEELIRISLLRGALREEILSPRKEEFIAEVEERGITFKEAQNEYWESYVDGLVLKSHIKILDPELKKLFGVEEKAS